MIPTDLAARLKLLVESAVQPLAAVREIPRDPPAFTPGRRFTALIETVLPDGTYKALVAGRAVTLALAEPAKAGDTLELLTLERTPRAVIAALASDAQPAQPPSILSRAAQIIAQLLAGTRDQPPQPAALARGQPLLPRAPETGETLAPLLRQAVVESGMFYESHQAQWLTGRIPTAALLREPQGRLSPLAAKTPSPVNAAPGANSEPTEIASINTGLIDSDDAVAELLPRRAEPIPAPSGSVAAVPEELAPLVQQQLEALASHHLVWHGQVWPGQTVQWSIDEALRQRGPDGEDGAERWNTTLRLTLPHLGELTVNLMLTGNAVSLVLESDGTGSAQRLRRGRAELATAMGRAGLSLADLKVTHREPA